MELREKEDDPTPKPGEDLEQRIDHLQHFLEKQFEERPREDGSGGSVKKDSGKDGSSQKGMQILRAIYGALMENEVDEKYANMLVDEIAPTITPTSNLDNILSNVYQKLILKFGQPKAISLKGRKPKVVFFIGPTGVGKTTTIAKIASHYKVGQGKNVALATSDTYRIAATDQLQIYANILGIPMTVVYSADELNEALRNYHDYDMVLVDTAGFSHKNKTQRQELSDLMGGLDDTYDRESYLVISATTKYRDLSEIVDSYKEIAKEYKLIFTKLDETLSYGNLFNIRMRTGADMSYLTMGQNVPDDIEIFNAQRIVKHLLGGK